MAIPGITIEAPSTPALPFGLVSVADVSNATPHSVNGFDYQTLCGVGTNVAEDPCSPPAGTNEVQSATITGSPTGGTYTFSYGGQTTIPIAYNASNATVQSALEGLSWFNPGDVTVTGTATARVITFGGNYASTNVGQITPTNIALTGGTSPNITTATTTQGARTAKSATATLTTITGDPFTIYSKFDCRLVGMNRAEADRLAMQALTNGESHALEKYLLDNVFNTATDLTPVGGAVTPRIGLAALEQYAAMNYAGQPIIHVNRGTGSLLGDHIERRGTHLETVQGALISSGGGYIAAYAADGDSVMYVTGNVLIQRGQALTGFGQTLSSGAYTNEFTSLAERAYVVSTECIKAKISVTNDPTS